MSQTPDYDERITSSPATSAKVRTGRLPRILLLIAIGVIVLIMALVIAAAGGIAAGQKARSVQATETTTAKLSEQFEKGLEDLQNGSYGLAASRFRWILEINPEYPGAAQYLNEAQQQLNTDSPQPTGTIIPTTAANTLDEQFSEAEEFYENGQWEATIDRLQAIQGRNPDYRRVEVKEMLYEALTTLGLEYVRGNRLEEGLFLLEQAAAIRPLDDQIEGERVLASLYVAARTYWNLNWAVVIQNLAEIYQVAPYYKDVELRLHEARIEYGDQLVAEGMPCEAAEQYELALQMEEEQELRERFDEATDACLNPSPTPTETPAEAGTPSSDAEGTPTPTPGEGEPPASAAPTLTSTPVR